jgi:GntR family transcriptional regulator/MocR family aminotransferase
VGEEREPVASSELLVTLDREVRSTLHEQLEQRLREDVRSGRLPAGTKLPSSRVLAAELGVSRGVVLEAYAQLTAEGYLTAGQGASTRVAATPRSERPPVPAVSLEPRYSYELRPGLPDLAAFPREAWLRSLRTVLRRARFDVLGPGDPRGEPALRDELMRYLGRARGAAPEPEHTIVCAGFTQGFAIVCRTLRDRGVERIAIEEPGWVRHRLIAERAGLEPVPVAVDSDGIDVEMLRASGCEAVVVTPAHQFPSGAVLGTERRSALLEWADDADALIVEDDYDSELRYDRVALGALQGLAPERVCHIGSMSARLAPGLRLGWVLSPSWLSGALTYETALAEGPAPAIAQLALADFLARGELDRHLRRMRSVYRARRAALLSGVARWLPGAFVRGVPAGLFVLVVMGDGIEEGVAVSAAARLGVGVDGLSAHSLLGSAGPPGLVLGFGSLSEPGLLRAVELLGEAAGALRHV